MSLAIEMQNVSVQFSTRGGVVNALSGVNLTVEPGRIFGFLGPNGAGKTTTMHILLGFIEATEGEVRLFGHDVRHTIARQRIGYLPEHPDTYRFLTGEELLSMTASLFGLDRSTRTQRIGEAIEAVGMRKAVSRRIATYSRGMMQRICLAQALINDPDLLILDEPTGGLDPIGRMDIRTIISELRERGKTIFFSSHELSEVELVCDTLAILAEGRIAAQGPAETLVAPGERLEQVFMRVISEAGGAA